MIHCFSPKSTIHAFLLLFFTRAATAWGKVNRFIAATENASCAVSDEIKDLLDQAKSGNEAALAELFSRYRRQLRAMVAFRLDQNLRGRIDPSDILQDAYLDLAKRLPNYDPDKMSFFVWLRLVTKERLLVTHRQHLDAKKRDARRELVSTSFGAATSSVSLARMFADNYTSVAGKAIRAEQSVRVQAVLDKMDEQDREVIGLRIFEGLTNRETAEVIGINAKTSSSRFLRAIIKLKEELGETLDFNL